MTSDGAAGPAAETVPPPFDTSVAHQARMYDYLLGGKDNYASDREAVEQALKIWPDMPFTARANRAFLGRAVSYFAREAGVRQFLDIGTGIPTAGNTHQVAQAIAPESRVVYVDYDPIVLAHARALLTSDGGCVTDYVDADLRDTSAVLDSAARTLDFSRPVAVMLLSILHVIGDEDAPREIVGALLDAVPPGSYLALSHPASDIAPEQGSEAARRLNERGHQAVTLRAEEEVAGFFSGLEMVPPGLVQVQQWRPAVTGYLPGPVAMWAAVARKPG